MRSSDFFAGKKVLVAGASGFVGTNLTQRLLGLGASVTGSYYTRPPSENTQSINYIKSDFTSYDDCLKATENIDYVFMAAANTSGAEVIEKTPLVHLTPNVIMNAQMLAAAYENNVTKFCFISSNTVYPVTDFAVTEADVNCEFFEKYFIVGWMKLFSEKMSEMYASYINNPMSTIVVRPGNLYGPYDKFTWKESKVVAALIRKAVEKQNPLPVWGDGEDLKDFLYIDDFITGLLKVFEHSGSFEIVNIASGIPITIKEVLSEILLVTGHEDTEIEYDSSKPTMLPKRLINIDKAARIADWVPETSLASGLAATVSWYREKYTDLTPESFHDN